MIGVVVGNAAANILSAHIWWCFDHTGKRGHGRSRIH
jgi:hypothetical protein